MANIESFHAWQNVEAASDAAQQEVSALVRAGGEPTMDQLDEVTRLRSDASQKLREMVAHMKSEMPPRNR